jgi:cholesterol transport system auxiliary component
MKSLIIFISILFITGCSVTVPHVLEYRINPEIIKTETQASQCKDKTIKISQVFTSNSLMTKSMQYAGNRYKVFEFTQSEWASTPNKAITESLIKSVRNSSNFSMVSGYRSRTRTDLVLETNVDSFIQYFSNDDNSSYVDVSLSFTLVNARTGEPLSSKIIDKKLPTESADALGGVTALNTALSDVLNQVNIWLNGSCK